MSSQWSVSYAHRAATIVAALPVPCTVEVISTFWDTDPDCAIQQIGTITWKYINKLQWRHMSAISSQTSNHHKNTSKIHITGPTWGEPPLTGDTPHKGPAMRKVLPWHDVIMTFLELIYPFIHAYIIMTSLPTLMSCGWFAKFHINQW